MRVAALYDIHGNLPALEAVLAEAEDVGTEAVVFGGDVVGGPFSAEVYDRATAVREARFVRGNADRMVLEGASEFGVDWDAERARLGAARLETIRSWPLTVELEIDRLGQALFCHAVPAADEPIFTRLTPDAEVEQMLGDTEADLVVCGHTHVQFDRRLPGGLRVVNAGSVGMPYEGRRGAFWALVGPDIELRRTEYDVERAAAAIRRSLAADAEDHARRLLEPPGADEASQFFESRRGA